MLIDGQEVEAGSGERFDVVNPATGAVIAAVPAADAEDVDRAVRAAKRAFEASPWPHMSVFERAKVLNRFADLLEANLDRLYALETLNNGRPVVETRAQLARLAEWYRYANALLVSQRDAALPTTGPYVSYIQRVPLGVCGILTPFNHPMLILAQSLSGALAAGNTVVIKPSELTPLTTLLLGRLASEAGVPDGVVNVVTGLGRPTGEAIASHPDVAKVNFTGGEAGGRAVSEAAGRRFARVTAELGGKAPVIVFDDSDLETAVNGTAFGGFVAAGQTCIAGSRLLVQESIYDEFVDRLSSKADAICLGDPSDNRTQMGRSPTSATAVTVRCANCASDSRQPRRSYSCSTISTGLTLDPWNSSARCCAGRRLRPCSSRWLSVLVKRRSASPPRSSRRTAGGNCSASKSGLLRATRLKSYSVTRLTTPPHPGSTWRAAATRSISSSSPDHSLVSTRQPFLSSRLRISTCRPRLLSRWARSWLSCRTAHALCWRGQR
jgi:hypothetical protein